MKKLYLLFPLLFLIYWGCEDEKEEPINGFVKTFGGSDWDMGNSVQQTTDGGYIIVGTWFIKTDSLGNEECINESLKGNSVQQTTDGGYIITGSTRVSGNLYGDVWLIKTDSQGQEEWNQTFGGSGDDKGYSVEQTTDGGYIITGYTDSFGNSGMEVWLIKTDSQGQEEWNQTFGGTYYDIGYSVQQIEKGYIITGYTQYTDESYVWLIKTDSQGNEEWNQTFGGNGWNNGFSGQQTTDGGYIITGEKRPYGDDGIGFSDVWLIKTNSQGQEEWNQTFGGSTGDYGNSVQQTTDGGYIITGRTTSFGNGGGGDVWLIKTDSDGNTVPYGN